MAALYFPLAKAALPSIFLSVVSYEKKQNRIITRGSTQLTKTAQTLNPALTFSLPVHSLINASAISVPEAKSLT